MSKRAMLLSTGLSARNLLQQIDVTEGETLQEENSSSCDEVVAKIPPESTREADLTLGVFFNGYTIL
jgi:hypothetical protein